MVFDKISCYTEIVNKRKLFYSISVTILAIICVLFFWRNTIFLIALIALLVVAKHFLMPIKKELWWFLISAIIGTTAESLSMLSGPWSYANSNIFNFPIWLPFLWGLAGTTAISLYQGITETK